MDTTLFIGFFLRILRILLHLKFPSNSQDFTIPHTAFLENHSTPTIGKLALFEKSCRSGKEEARTGWSNVGRVPQKRSDANYIGWINLIQSNTTHCAKLGLMRVQESYIDTFTAQLAAPGLFRGFSFHSLKKLKVGDSLIHSIAQKKEHTRKTEFEMREF